ncbi:hypothetical protein SAMN05216271_2158 [Halopseudomonas sabulinigri]|uniref:histidine kinase n=1 Tax=Halopseudomonas sabulinigri TaxID=472181 RepID=A0A1H1T325_9GAMM|nr:response regulator [Halopseudomonas sabulinigri]SDS54571.1 hypothetical protein SAMN05216271_2158 [Halopseudomonas sabulinigri]
MLVSASLVAYVSGNMARERAINATFLQLENAARVRAETLSQLTHQLALDVRFLAKTPPIAGIARALANGGYDALEDSSTTVWKNRLGTIFKSYTESREDVAQVRLIGVADQGLELVRVERKPDRVANIAPNRLQIKASEPYFVEGMQTSYDHVYFSNITLNREQGVVQRPYAPMLRALTPVFDEHNQRYGVVVINQDVSAALEHLTIDDNDSLRIYATGPNGDYLVNPDKTLEFGADLGKPLHWQADFTASQYSQQPDHYTGIKGEKRLAVRAEVLLNGEPRDTYVWAALPYSQVTSTVDGARLVAFGATTLIGFLGALLAFVFFRQKMVLEQHQRRLAAIVEGAQDAIIGQDLSGQITSWNPGAESLFGYSQSEVIGKDLMALVFPEHFKQSEARVLASIKQHHHYPHYEAAVRTRSGGEVDVSVAVSVIFSAPGEIIGLSRSFRNISEQMRAQRKIQQLNSSLESKVAARTAELKSRSQMTLAILDVAPTPIITFNAAGEVKTRNSAFTSRLGQASNADTPLLIDNILGSQDVTAVADIRHRLRNLKAMDDKRDGLEVQLLTRSGQYLPFYLSLGLSLIDDQEFWVAIFTDLSELNQQKLELKEAMDNLSMAADVAELGIWIWNLADNALYWDSKMYAIYELSEAQAIDFDSWQEHVHAEDRSATVELISHLVHQTAANNYEFRILTRAGGTRYIQAAAYVQRNDLGTTTRVVGVNRDITAQRLLEIELSSAKEVAQQANIAKSAFLANMSHEIRTPMNAVIGMLQLIDHQSLPTSQSQYITNAMSAAKSLLWLLNDILDYSKIESGKMELDPHSFELDQLLQDLAVVMTGIVIDKSLEILFDIDPGVPMCLRGDGMRLKQVLINLASNAVKFTAQGQVVVAVELTEKTDGRAHIRFSVADSGIGISEEQMTRIFDGFSQAEASTSRQYGGSGLGLVISSRLVRLMGGALQAESTVGQGSRFHFSLALDYDPSASELFLERLKIEQPLKILVVDDNASSVLIHIRMLQSLGWLTEGAESGEDAVTKVVQAAEQQRPFDVILMDWRMPGLDGIATADLVSQALAGERAPAIIMMTAYGKENIQPENEPAEAQIALTLSKPATLAQLHNAVMQALGREQQPMTTAEFSFDDKVLSSIKVLVVEDNLLNQQVVATMLENSGATVAVVSSGVAAISRLTSQKAERPDIVLMDVQMPDIDGLEATRRLRQHSELDDLPILAMTANVSPQDRKNCIAAGMNGHIGKPFDFAELTRTLLYWTGTKAGALAADVAGAAPTPAATADSTAAIRARFGGNVAPFISTFVHFKDEANSFLEKYDAIAAQRDLAAAAALFHTLKGMAGTLGLQALSTFAEKQEKRAANNHAAEDGNDLFTPLFRAEFAELTQAACRVVEDLIAEESVEPDSLPLAPVGQTESLRELLARLVPLLEAGNLEALDNLRQLMQHARDQPALSESLTTLAGLIEQLDFATASNIARTLLEPPA